MIVHVLYLGGLRDLATGVRSEEVDVVDDADLGDLLQVLTARHPALDGLMSSLRVAVNLDLVAGHHPLGPGDEVALLPPVAGGDDDLAPTPAEPPGTPESRCRLVREPIDVGEVVRAVVTPGHGAVVTFVGLVREHNEGRHVVRLDYEAYESMAERSLAKIVRRCEEASPGAQVAVSHRTGTLGIGDVAVAIAAAAPHRAEAFEACRLCIELIKQDTPIWKRETSPDGTYWLGVGS